MSLAPTCSMLGLCGCCLGSVMTQVGNMPCVGTYYTCIVADSVHYQKQALYDIAPATIHTGHFLASLKSALQVICIDSLPARKS